jgi:hypothetical protein
MNILWMTMEIIKAEADKKYISQREDISEGEKAKLFYSVMQVL